MTQVDPQAVKKLQREQWGRAASGWRRRDERLRQLTASATERMLQLAAIGPGQRVLDIACGTGEPALPAAAIVGESGFVLATDMAPEMLEVARDKAAAQGLENVEFRLVDGEHLDFEPESFDAVTCRWGIMFMPEPLRCLRQACAALKPGGRFVAAVWGPPDRNPWLVTPMVGLRKYLDTTPPDPTQPGGPLSFAAQGKLESTLTEAGLRETAVEGLELTMADFESGREYWQFQLDIAGPLATLFAQLPADRQEAAATVIAAAAGGGDAANKVHLTGYTLLGSGLK
jgi:SAM-dependent methyltransferase